MYHFCPQTWGTRWDAIQGLIESTANQHWVTDNWIPPVGPGKWARRLSGDTAYTMASTDLDRGVWLGEQVKRTLLNQEGLGAAPSRVIIDELQGANPPTAGMIYWASVHLKNNYPSLRGLWGVAVAHWSDNFNLVAAQPAIDGLLQAGAFIVLEQYVTQAAYCSRQRSQGTGAADIWLASRFNGGMNSNQWTDWLWQHRQNLGSNSPIHHMFGITDGELNGANPIRYQDRMFFVLRTRSTHPELMHYNNGAVGSWVWDGRVNNGYLNRDVEFRNSWFHFCYHYRTSATYTVQC